jgi:hypothetical protein
MTIKVSFVNSAGVEVTDHILDNTVVTFDSGEAKKTFVFNKVKAANKPIEEMTAEELKLEIRNAGSVLYKASHAEKPNQETIAKAQARLDAAKALAGSKFPTVARENKAAKAKAILDALQKADLPSDQKAAAMAKLNELIATLEVKAKAPKAEAKATNAAPAAEAAPEAKEEVKAESTNPVKTIFGFGKK